MEVGVAGNCRLLSLALLNDDGMPTKVVTNVTKEKSSGALKRTKSISLNSTALNTFAHTASRLEDLIQVIYVQMQSSTQITYYKSSIDRVYATGLFTPYEHAAS